MGEILRKRLLQERFESPVHEAVLSLLVAAGHVRDTLDRAVAAHGITGGQYNVLRILRGVHPEGHARCEIARRLIDRAPDVTRLIDRLEREGLVERLRSPGDRRLSLTRITRKGLRLLEDMRPAMDEALREIAARLPPTEARELARLCESLYAE